MRLISGPPCPRGLISRRTLLCAATAAGLGLASPAYATNRDSEAESFVRSSIDKSYAILNRDDPDRQTEFRAQLLSMVDAKRVALFTLGQYARDASDAETEEFVAAFTNLLVAVYQRGLETYRGQPFEVTGSAERAPGDVIVNAVAGNSDDPGSKAHIDFRVRLQPGGGKIITDVQIEGVWLALTQRAEFIAYLQQHRADIGALSSEVAQKATQVRVAANKPSRRGDESQTVKIR